MMGVVRGVNERLIRRYEPWLFGAALAVTAAVCLVFRYLPMVDLPQHYAMVSVFTHYRDPAYGFAERFAFDLAHRPYASVYLVAAGLAKVLPLAAAMRIVVAICTLLPVVGVRALLAATGRPRHLALLAVPLSFGSLWFWGFLNFIAGTGLLLIALALVVRSAREPTRRRSISLGLLSLLILVTHVHGMFMLIPLAPVLAWGFRRDEPTWWRPIVRAVAPIVPAAIGTVAFVLVTWSQATGTWERLDMSLPARVQAFPDFLATGLPAPWPLIACGVLVGAIALSLVLRAPSPAPRRESYALALAFAGQLLLYFVLPVNTPTATYVSARHALLIVLFGLPLLPAARHAWAQIVFGALFAAGGLTLALVEISGFDQEARSFDPIVAVMKPNKRVAPLIFDKGSSYVSDRTFPYLHFAAYYQAASGGDLSRTFAVVWNVPVRYRADYVRYEVPEKVEWDPRLFSPTRDLPHFDYLLMRGPAFMPRSDSGLVVVAKSGPWTLIENPKALP